MSTTARTIQVKRYTQVPEEKKFLLQLHKMYCDTSEKTEKEEKKGKGAESLTIPTPNT